MGPSGAGVDGDSLSEQLLKSPILSLVHQSTKVLIYLHYQLLEIL